MSLFCKKPITILCVLAILVSLFAASAPPALAADPLQEVGQAEIIRQAKENTGVRIFEGNNLSKVDVPIGGLGSGAVYFNGNVKPHNWDIGLLGNTPLVTDNSLFSITVNQGGSKTTKVLQGCRQINKDAFADQPCGGNRGGFMTPHGQYFIGTCEVAPAWSSYDDAKTGYLHSNSFTMPATCTKITALVGGGSDISSVYFALADAVTKNEIAKVTGNNAEAMSTKTINVPAEYRGKEVFLKIVDVATGGWGHINVDYIRLMDDANNEVPSTFVNGDFETGDLTGWTKFLCPLTEKTFDDIELKLEYPFAYYTFKEDDVPVVTKMEVVNPMIPNNAKDSSLPTVLVNITLTNTSNAPLDVSVLSSMANGISGTNTTNTYSQDAKGSYITLTSDRNDITQYTGSLCLWTSEPNVTHTAGVSKVTDLITQVEGSGLDGANSADKTKPVAGMSVPVTLAAGESKTVTFNWTWYFPYFLGRDLWGAKTEDVGRRYANFYNSIGALVSDLAARRQQLLSDTKLYHDTMYDTTLPYYFIDAVTANSVVMRARTMYYTKAGDVYGWEGSDGTHSDGGCCLGNCQHVWNYAQTMASLYPELARQWRTQDLVRTQRADGLLNNRMLTVPFVAGDAGEGPAVDGVLGNIEAAYREHLNTGDNAFLTGLWPNIKKAMDAAITIWDVNEDGLIQAAASWNTTFDGPMGGLNTFTGAQYLSALRAAEKMALIMGDPQLAARYKGIYEKGFVNLSRETFNGEYFIQKGANQYGNGVMTDQLFGQTKAYLEQLGYVLPEAEVKSALKSIFDRNFFYPVGDRYKAEWGDVGRIYAWPDDPALLNCTFPGGGDGTALYLDESWPGFEYPVATSMLYAGLTEEAMAVIYAVRSRHDGDGFNPLDERECGGYYARSLASYGILSAALGIERDGPAKSLGFNPNVTPENIKGFFTYVDGWGTFAQSRNQSGVQISQSDSITVKYGSMSVKDFSFYVSNSENTAQYNTIATLTINDVAQSGCAVVVNRNKVTLTLPAAVSLVQGDVVKVEINTIVDESNLRNWTDVSGQWNFGTDGRTGQAAVNERAFSLSDRTAVCFDLEGSVTPGAGASGLVFGAGAAPAAGSYVLSLDVAANRVKLLKFPLEELASAAQATALQAGTAYTVKLSVSKQNVKAYLDGVLVLDAAATGYTSGLVGTYVFAGQGTFKNLMITDRVDGVGITQDHLSMAPGEEATLSALVSPVGALNKKVTWRSDDNAVVSVDATGKVTSLTPGQTVITATTEDGGYTDTCTVFVRGFGVPQTPTQLTPVGSGTWTAIAGGWRGTYGGDAFMLAQESGSDFSYEGDLKITSAGGAAALVFRSRNTPSQGCYVLNIDRTASVIKFFKFPYAVISQVGMTIQQNQVYHLKVVAVGNRFTVYLNNNPAPIITATDNSFRSGRYGINVWNTTNAEITNLKFVPILTDKTQLGRALQDFEALNEGNYSFPSYASARAVYLTSQAVYTNDAADQPATDAATDALRAAINALDKMDSGVWNVSTAATIEDGTARVRVRVRNNQGESPNVAVLVAAYDETGVMLDYASETTAVAKSSLTTRAFDLDLSGAVGEVSIKAFLWSSETFIPLLDATAVT